MSIEEQLTDIFFPPSISRSLDFDLSYIDEILSVGSSAQFHAVNKKFGKDKIQNKFFIQETFAASSKLETIASQIKSQVLFI